jgi:hypothetical protein
MNRNASKFSNLNFKSYRYIWYFIKLYYFDTTKIQFNQIRQSIIELEWSLQNQLNYNSSAALNKLDSKVLFFSEVK